MDCGKILRGGYIFKILPHEKLVLILSVLTRNLGRWRKVSTANGGKFMHPLNLVFYPLQYSRLENPMDGEASWATVHGVAKSRTRLSDFTFTFRFHALEKEMAAHPSVLAWRVPGTADPGGLPSMGSQSRTRLSSSSKVEINISRNKWWHPICGEHFVAI